MSKLKKNLILIKTFLNINNILLFALIKLKIHKHADILK